MELQSHRVSIVYREVIIDPRIRAK